MQSQYLPACKKKEKKKDLTDKQKEQLPSVEINTSKREKERERESLSCV